MRAFLAVELPDDTRHLLAQLQRQLATSHADVKWTEEANLHITMRFLGEINEEQRQGLEGALREAAAHTHAIPITLTSLGAFPPPSPEASERFHSMASPRVLWVGVGEGKNMLTKIAEAIERGVISLGLPKEDRPFSAHVTLGRLRSPKNRAQLITALRETQWQRPKPFTVTHLTLFQSTLTSSGPIYTPLSKFPFSAEVKVSWLSGGNRERA